MRVTDSMIFDRANVSIGRARSLEEAASAEASSGLRVRHPGDDPGAAGLVVGQSLNENRLATLSSTIGRAADELQSADNALDAVSSALSRARELTVQLSNDTYSASERSAAANEVNGLMKTVVAAMNTQMGKRYIFGGTQDTTAPFDAAGNYLGDTNVRKVEIAPGVLQDASVRGDVALKGVGGGVDVLASLQALSTALTANNVTAVRASLTPLDAGISQVSLVRTQAGSNVTVLDAAGAAANSAKLQATTAKSHLQEADTIESATKLSLAERALDAALSASAKTFRLTLLDKM